MLYKTTGLHSAGREQRSTGYNKDKALDSSSGFGVFLSRNTAPPPPPVRSLRLYESLAWRLMHMLTPQLLVPERPQTFHYNRSFTERQSKYTDGAWHSLFPRQGGYFRHPEIAPSRSAFAVFHQLHCLVRKSVTAAVSANARALPGCDTHGLLGGVRCCIGR